MRVAVFGGLLVGFLLYGGMLAGKAVQASEPAPSATPVDVRASTHSQLPCWELPSPAPPQGLIAPTASPLERRVAPAGR